MELLEFSKYDVVWLIPDLLTALFIAGVVGTIVWCMLGFIPAKREPDKALQWHKDEEGGGWFAIKTIDVIGMDLGRHVFNQSKKIPTAWVSHVEHFPSSLFRQTAVITIRRTSDPAEDDKG